MSDEAKMPLTEHLGELRIRIIRSMVAIGIGFSICYSFVDRLFGLLIAPLHGYGNENVALIGTGVAEAFFTQLKVSFIGGLFLAIPVVLYEIWQFIVPALYENERKYARPFVVFGTGFFLIGAFFCYEVVLPIGYVYFMQQYALIGVSPQLRISEYLTFTSQMLLAFGTIFELPVVTFFLARVGVVNHTMLLQSGRYAIVIIFIVAAVLTPPDVASQMLMAIPLLVLYGISILVAYFFALPGRATGTIPEAGPERIEGPSD